jgi:hypothetical protein
MLLPVQSHKMYAYKAHCVVRAVVQMSKHISAEGVCIYFCCVRGSCVLRAAACDYNCMLRL